MISIGALLALSACEKPDGTAKSRTDAVPRSELAIGLAMGEDESFFIRISNESKDTIRILKPLDGSYESWIMPHYKFTLDDGKGSKFDGFPRCGFFGHPYDGTIWPNDYIIELQPGEAHELESRLPFVIPQAGEYTVTFRYVFIPDSEQLTTNPPGDLKYPTKLWRGSATSRPLRVKLKARLPVVG